MPNKDTLAKLKHWSTIERFVDGLVYCKRHPTTPRLVDPPSTTWCKECKTINKASKKRYETVMKADPEYRHQQYLINQKSRKKLSARKKEAKQLLKVEQQNSRRADKLAAQLVAQRELQITRLARLRLKVLDRLAKERLRKQSRFCGPCCICETTSSYKWTKGRCATCYAHFLRHGIDRREFVSPEDEHILVERRLRSATRRMQLLKRLGARCACGEVRFYMLVFDPPTFKRQPVHLIDMVPPGVMVKCSSCVVKASGEL